MFYPRAMLPELEAHMDNKQVTVLTGMRRTGKTTLLKHHYDEYVDYGGFPEVV